MDILYFYYTCHWTKWNKNFKYKTILILISHAVTPLASRGRCCCDKPNRALFTSHDDANSFFSFFLTPERGSEWMSAAQNMRTCPDSGAEHTEIIYVCLPRSITLPLTRWSVINHARENSSSQQRLLFTSLFSFHTQYFNTLLRSLKIFQ